ncbi:S-M checkpoint control protein CID1 and related nucleotidyltransferases [Plasmopara halstedii]|uniref:S-M checkpoint control protein CID1 and related nucleotidyltransferases n=1 Tax=Plasmopara halstedii TaxID=4781 RepID=A0A0P1A4S4_PLAHL|nr:S-M checkpoint control protein CID1 and related nucleotidyltransferases [Plasmopara halstedii]CEG35558.1 S-M checkpoint control protein CID1 and related nucleotidyltransferases [Plasmopara halstedii]|eukprot:XP_024571927.1 S-M checkpoint control protein CID1 and related nucleotidyltransferases [Plasmopara halstedii]
MDVSMAETAAKPVRSQLRPKSSKSNSKIVSDASVQSASSQRKQKPQNWQPKVTSTASINDTNTVMDTLLVCYQDTPWYKAGNGDLVFAQWLLNRCYGVGDTTAPQSESATKRLFALYKVQRKLRRELALGSKNDEASLDKDTHEEEDDEENMDIEDPNWSVEKIVEHVGDVLRVSRRELRKQKQLAERSNTKLKGGMESVVVAEVIDNATELILSRAMVEDETLLRNWMMILKEADALNEDETSKCHLENLQNDQKTIKKKTRLKKSKTNLAEDLACEQVESFIVFLKQSEIAQSRANVTRRPLEAVDVWTAELQQIVENSGINQEEEERRRQVALDIQMVLRREITKWRHCEVILYGSSLTHFGSRHSDLDMCLLSNGRTVGNAITPPMGKRQLQRLVDGNICESSQIPASDAEMVEHLQNLYTLVQKSIKKLTQALNSLDRSKKISDKQMKQRNQLNFFHSQMRLLCKATVAKLTQYHGSVEPTMNVNADGKSARLQSIIAAARRCSEDLYLLRATLERAAKCKVRHVITGARVPIIRFLHTRRGQEYDCDLCFENVLATRNTPLLRAYAAFDERARNLGLVVKHWAKQRGISDASSGFLSSYSYVLLCIYYLQIVHVLPNLQDPQLLKSANIPPELYNDVNIAFCEDRSVAQTFHKRTLETNSTSMALTTLLAGFFEFYATRFDFARRVVTIRSPEILALKLAQWGSRKSKTWRMSIQDPLETGRDLGCVLQFKGQEKIIREFRRAHEMLERGASFLNEVCTVENAVEKSSNVQQPQKKEVARARKVTIRENLGIIGKQTRETRQQEMNPQRSYMLVLQSADEDLTRKTIELIFRRFKKSFRVIDVKEVDSSESVADGNGNKRWKVELSTKALQCPRALSRRTRIDWTTSDGRVSRVWVHHQALFATPPCQNCLSPEHATSKCPINDDEGCSRGENRVRLEHVQRHILSLNLSEPRSSEPAKKSSRRHIQELKNGALHTNGETEKKISKRNSSNNPIRRAKKKTNGDAKAEVVVENLVRRVDIAESVTVSSKACVETKIDAQTKKVTPKTKKWRQRPLSKKDHSKRDCNQ